MSLTYSDTQYNKARKRLPKPLWIAPALVMSLMITVMAVSIPLQAQNPAPFSTDAAEPSFDDAVEILQSQQIDGRTPNGIHEFNGLAVFTVSYSDQLWFSNGTDLGVRNLEFDEWDNLRLFDVYTAVTEDRVYFGVMTNQGWEVWSTDGTEEGTVPEFTGSEHNFNGVFNLFPFGDGIAFTTNYPADTQNRSLFLYNSQTDGLKRVSGIEEVSDAHRVDVLTIHNDQIYLVEKEGEDLYVTSVGENGGINRVWSLPDNGTSFRSIRSLTSATNQLYFLANDGTGPALWSLMGGSADRLFNPSEEAGQQRGVFNLTAVGDRAFFFSRPWDHEEERFPVDTGLYYASAGNITRLDNEDFGMYLSTAANNNIVAHEVNGRLVLTTTSVSDPGNVWWRVDTEQNSLQPLLHNGSTLSTSNDQIISADGGAWLSDGSSLYFTNGTSDGTTRFEISEGVVSINNLTLVEGEPWFTARASSFSDAGIWKLGELNPSIPAVTLMTPGDTAEDVELTPGFEWEEASGQKRYRLQLATSDIITARTIVVDTLVHGNKLDLAEELEENTAYYWHVRVEDWLDINEWSDIHTFTTNASTSSESPADLPDNLTLVQNYPNPFNPTTTIRYELPEASHVALAVYDMLGRRVTVLENGRKPAGRHQISFDASNLSAGSYIYRLQTDEEMLTRTMMLVK